MRKKAAVIAEAGINHQGDVEILKELADMSFRAGTDYLKIQMRTPEICVPEEQKNKPRIWQGKEMRYIDYKKEIELSEDDLWEFDAYVRRHYGTGEWGRSRWFPSVWDLQSLDRAVQFNLPWIKVPSALITNDELMGAVSHYGNIIISTGMSTEEEIGRAIGYFDIGHHLVVMHCCSAYPCPDSDVGLSALSKGEDPNLPWSSKMEHILERVAWKKGRQDELNNWKVGFSSHSISPYPAIYAALLGAEFIEVHVTLDRTMEGSDHAASLEEPGLRLLCREIERIPILWGEPVLEVKDSELEKRKSLRGV